jgi:hypothetical protein
MHFPVLLITSMSLALLTASHAPLAQYRGLTLGDSVAVVVAHLELAAADVKVVHERPALVQELTWRPHRFVSGVTVEPDPLAEMVLTFHTGRLARIVAIYDRERTRGLTDADLHEVMGATYGPSMLIASPARPPVNAADRLTIGRWQDADAFLLLWREQYPSRVGLTLTSIAAEAALREAIKGGLTLDAAEAPARDVARRTAEAAAIEARDEKVRRDNKAGFKP